MADKQRHISDLSGDEIAEIGRAQVKIERAESFALGLPVTYAKDGIVVREYPDGRVVPLDAVVDEAAE
jgi:hypothetical protein